MTTKTNIPSAVGANEPGNASHGGVSLTFDQLVEEECISLHASSTAPDTYNAGGDKLDWVMMPRRYQNRLRMFVANKIVGQPAADQ